LISILQPVNPPVNDNHSLRYEEEHIQNLMSKGFTREQAEDAHFNRKKGAASVRRVSALAVFFICC
jgi:hypothetical protein